MHFFLFVIFPFSYFKLFKGQIEIQSLHLVQLLYTLSVFFITRSDTGTNAPWNSPSIRDMMLNPRLLTIPILMLRHTICILYSALNRYFLTFLSLSMGIRNKK